MRERGELRAVDAMEVNFTNFDFSGQDFSGANFVRCVFEKCSFDNATLRGANFEGAVFRDCSIDSADIREVNFWGANIVGLKKLETTSIKRANFYLSTSSWQQKQFIRDANTLSLCDYGSFADYFLDKEEVSSDLFSTMFPWYNHRYFRIMFGKNKGSALGSGSSYFY